MRFRIGSPKINTPDIGRDGVQVGLIRSGRDLGRLEIIDIQGDGT